MIISIQNLKERLKFNNNKQTRIFVGGAILCGILLAFIGSQIDWTTIRRYKNEQAGYELRFPLGWKLHKEEVIVSGTRNTYHPVRNIIELDIPGQPKPAILISFNQSMEPQSVIDYIRNSSECSEVGETDGEIIMVDGIEGRIFKDTTCARSGETRVYLMKGGTGYNFVFKGAPINMDVVNHVLNNFSFLR